MGRMLAVAACAVAVGLGTWAMVANDPEGSLAGSSPAGAIALLGGGWAAVAGGMITRHRLRSSLGPVLVAGGFAWFVGEWNNPGARSAIVFTVGLIGYAACPPFVAQFGLGYPDGHLDSRTARAATAAAYVGAIGVLGLGPALFSDPAHQGCSDCPANLVSITTDDGVASWFQRWGIRLGVAWSAVLAGLCIWRLWRATPAARLGRLLVLVPVAVFLGAVTSTYVEALDREAMTNSSFARRMWRVEAVALGVVAIGVVWERIRVRRARAALAELVVELAQAPPRGGLRDVLADALGDDSLQIAYPIGGGRHVDARGLPVEVGLTRERATTALERDGDTIAVIVQRRDRLGDPRLVEVASVAGLALENERLGAEAQAQLVELRDSRARLVADSDTERRRLQRDLHDGAQQRLVGARMTMGLLRARVDRDGPTAISEHLDSAEAQLARAVVDLRQLAAGIHPSVLADFGLAAALRALAESDDADVLVRNVPAERFALSVETTAYLVAQAAARCGPVSVDVTWGDDRLVVDVELEAATIDLDGVDERIGALDGVLTITSEAAGLRILAELPCGS